MERLTQTAYAARRGITQQAVSQHVAKGLIEANSEGLIDPEAADQALDEHLTEHRGGKSPAKRAGAGTFGAARTRLTEIETRRAELKLRREAGELVERARAVALVFELARREREAWSQWPTRIAALVAADLGADPHLALTVLERHVREHLAQLAEPRLDMD